MNFLNFISDYLFVSLFEVLDHLEVITVSSKGHKGVEEKRMKSLKGHDEVITLKSIRYQIHRLKN